MSEDETATPTKYPYTPSLSPERRLPVEVIEAIIDHLSDDGKALESCSLVCKALTRRAQFQLFSNTTLNLRHRDEVLQLMQSASAVVPFIRHLHLDCYYVISFEASLRLLVGFTGIKSLTISNLLIHCVDPRRISDIFSNSNITIATVLRLLNITSRYVFELVSIVCAFPCLQTLVVSVDNVSGIDLMSIPTGFHLPPALTALQLGFGFDGMMNWLMSLPSRPALRTVSLCPFFSNDIWRDFLHHLEHSLETLFLFIPGLDRPFDLHRHTRLRSVQLVLDGTDWTVPDLSQLPPHLEEMAFDLLLAADEHPVLQGLHELDEALQRPYFSRLNKVAVRFLWTRWPDTSVPDLCQRVVDDMPQCHARGILSVTQAVYQFLHL